MTRFAGLSAGSGERSGASRRGFFRSGAGPRPARPRIDATRSAASGPDAASASGAGLRLWGRSRFFLGALAGPRPPSWRAKSASRSSPSTNVATSGRGALAMACVHETPSTSLQHDFVRVDASDFCVQISRTRAEMINGPRRSRIGPKLTEIRASKVEKKRKNPGVSRTLRGTGRRSASCSSASPSVEETPRKPGVFGLWRPLSRSDSSRFGSFLDR